MSAEHAVPFPSADGWNGRPENTFDQFWLDLDLDHVASFGPLVPEVDLYPSFQAQIHSDSRTSGGFDDSALLSQSFTKTFPIHSNAYPTNLGRDLPIGRQVFKTVKYRSIRKGEKHARGRPRGISEDEEKLLRPLFKQYIEGPQSLEDFLIDVELLHGTRVGKNAARGLLKRMGLRKNKQQYRNATGLARENLRTRQRGAKAFPPRVSGDEVTYKSSSTTKANEDHDGISKQLSGDEDELVRQMLHHLTNYVQGHLDTSKGTWVWNDFGISGRGKAPDHSALWKTISDQCHGASFLIQAKRQLKAFKTMQDVYCNLSIAAQQHNPWVIVYVWKILLYIRGISVRLHPPDSPFIRRFISFLWKLYFHLYGTSIQFVPMLALLHKVPTQKLKIVIGLLYQRTIREFEKFKPIKDHPVLLGMRGHYQSYFGGEFHIEVFEKYQALTTYSLNKQVRHPREMILISEYMLYAYRERGNLRLAEVLARTLIETMEAEALQTWGVVTYCYVVASKYLARVLWECEDEEEWWKPLRLMVDKLRTGDRECRTRAAQVQETMAGRYSYLKNPQQARAERDTRDEILDTIQDWPADQSPWRVQGESGGGEETSAMPRSKMSKRARRRLKRSNQPQRLI